ncbi:MAG: hypothetical protein IKU01_11035 [Bacteroidales bacterium]|nr:hypothetical protein [Bacteroidales bacterium]
MNIEKNELENTQSNDIKNQMIIDENIINGIKEIGRHTKFFSIVMYVSIVLIVLGGALMLIYGRSNEEIIAGVIYIVLAGVTYFITKKLWKASKSYRSIEENNSIDNLELGVKNMTSFWRMSATLCKLYLAILALIFVLAFFAYIFS